MTDFLNNTTPVANGVISSSGNEVYPWMRVRAGGGISDFSEVQMSGPIYDKNGAEILSVTPVPLMDSSVVWRPGGTPADGVITSADSSEIGTAISSNPNLKKIYIDSSIAIPDITTVIDCDGRVELLAFNNFASPPNFMTPIDVSGIGVIKNCPRMFHIRVSGTLATQAFVQYDLNTKYVIVNYEYVMIIGDLSNIIPFMLFNLVDSYLTLQLNAGYISDKATVNPAIEVTGSGSSSLDLYVEDFANIPYSDTAYKSPPAIGIGFHLSGTANLSASLNKPQVNATSINYDCVVPYNIYANDSVGSANIIQKVTPLVQSSTQLIDTVSDMLNCLKQQHFYNYVNILGNTSTMNLSVGVPQNITLSGATITQSLFGSPSLRAQYIGGSDVNFNTSSTDGVKFMIDYDFVFDVTIHAGNSVLLIYFETNSVEQQGRKVVQIPPVGESLAVSGKVFIKDALVAGQSAVFRVDVLTAGCSLIMSNATMNAKTMPFHSTVLP